MPIPASSIVTVNPGVLGAGGSPLALNGVVLSTSTYLPTSGVASFSSAEAVSDFFGSSSDEVTVAEKYFLGYDNSTIKPDTLYFASYADADRAAWLQTGSFAGTVLEDIQALGGVLTIVTDGVSFTSGTINLSAATSYTNAATLITAAFSGAGKPICTWDAVRSRFYFTSPTTGAASTIGYATGSMSAAMKATLATGAGLSQGIVADTPDTAMDRVKLATQNWVDFMTMWEPDTDNKQLFAEWVNAQNQRFAYVAWDTDANASVSGNTTNFGYIAKDLAYNTVMVVGGDPATAVEFGEDYEVICRNLAAMALGTTASIDFSRANARITFAFKSQAGMIPSCTDEQLADNLIANGYSFYGKYATANDQFNFLYNGQVSGVWAWMDTFVNQVYMNSQFQLALMSLLTSVGSIPYNESGYSLIRAAMLDPINAALNFGAIRFGVSLSSSQAAQVNQAAGRDVATIIQQQGYYLQILDPGAQVRGNRGTPVINFWYTDGGAIHKITVASIDIM